MSRFEFKLPDIGEGVSEGEIVTWLVKGGDAVNEGQDMVEVMTDKATVTIGAPKSGKVSEIRAKEGDTVPVGSVLVVLDLEGGGDAPAAAAKPAPKADAKAAGKPNGNDTAASAVGDLKDVLPGVPKAPRIEGFSDGNDESDGDDDYRNDKPLAAPATRKLARELGVDLRAVKPTGEGGRVTREDVERLASGGGGARPSGPHSRQTMRPTTSDVAPAPAAPVPAAPAPAPPVPVAGQQGEQRVPIRGLRKRIYENMARAKRTAAHFTYVDECDVTDLKKVRERAKSLAGEVPLTFLPFIVKAVVASLKKHPSLNCLVDDTSMEMVLRKTYDIGIAVATDAGLTVPVLRGADRLSILDVARELERLSTEARAGKTRREDLGGSSFTITSLGKQGGLFATPVVNYPEVAILGVHQIKKKPVVRGDQIAIGEVMLLSLSFDHRIIDGHVGAAFAQEVIGYLQIPERLLIEM